MKALRGKSGVLHTFSDAAEGPGGRTVMEAHGAEISENDVIGFYAKIIDVGARSGEMTAPSCTPEARKLALLYGIGIKVTGKDDGEASTIAA